MKKDLIKILNYISMDLFFFIGYSLKKAFLAFSSLVIIIGIFFIGMKAGMSYQIVLIASVMILLLVHIIDSFFFYRQQLNMNNKFNAFLNNEDISKIANKDNTLKDLRYIKKKIAEVGVFPSRRVVFAIIGSNGEENISKLNDKKKEFLKIRLLGYLTFFVFLVLFETISLGLAFTNSIRPEFILFLSLIGYTFAYALFLIIINPLMYLLFQLRLNTR